MELFDLREWPGFVLAGGDLSQPALIESVIIDSRRIFSPRTLFVALPGRFQHGHNFVGQVAEKGVKYALVGSSYQSTPELDSIICLLRVPSPLIAMQEIAKVYRLQLPTTIIAITGSVGKTLTKDLLYSFLQYEKKTFASPESFNSQIGVPLSLFQISKSDQLAVIEVGISMEGEMKRLIEMIQPDHAILTKILDPHLGFINSRENLIREKLLLLEKVALASWLLLPVEFQYLFSSSKAAYAWNQFQSHLPHLKLIQSNYSYQEYEIIFPDQTFYRGKIDKEQTFYLEIIQISIKAAWLLGISSISIIKALENYSFQTMRIERWKSLKGGTIINERYCADISSLETALNSLKREALTKGRRIFLFGGIRQSETFSSPDYQQIISLIQQAKIDLLLLVGESIRQHLAPYIQVLIPYAKVETFNTQKEALEYAHRHLSKDDLLLIKGAQKLSVEEITQSLEKVEFDNILSINLAAIEKNLDLIRSRLDSSIRLTVMIKAFGYGTDSVDLARFLEGCGIDLLGVAHIDEALILKQAGIRSSIFLINATIDEADLVAEWNFEVGVSNILQIEALESSAKKYQTKTKVHLHVDTGMGRFGCRPEDVPLLAQLIVKSEYLIFEGLMTHLPSADVAQDIEFTKQELDKFRKICNELAEAGVSPNWIHAGNSYAALRFSQAGFNMVRLGLGIFGFIPESKLHFAMSLTSRIVGINKILKGESVGYGRTYIATRDEELIAMVPLGYADGLHTQYSGKGYALLHGKKAPFIGRICMDFMMIDVTDIPNAKVGDRILIFGKNAAGEFIDPNILATNGGTHVYQLLTCLGQRIRRIFVYDEGL